jgi:TolA-binding protein
MKRTERQHLRENEIEQFARGARELVDTRRRETQITIGAIVVIGVIVLGYFGWHEHVQSRAHDLLAQAIAVQDARVGPPPAPGQPSSGLYFPTERERAQTALTKFKVAADAYPSTDAGLYARYQEASTQLALDTPAEAAKAYQQVIDKAGSSLYGQMARLGLAEAQARSGQYEQAINAFKELAQHKDGPLPIDGILMQLGRTYLDAGKTADAQQTFNRLVQEYPESPFSTDAKRALDQLKKTT